MKVRYFTVPGVYTTFGYKEQENTRKIVVIEERDKSHAGYYMKQLKEKIANLEKTLENDKFTSLPQVHWLDQSGPVVMSLHSYAGSMTESADSLWAATVANEQEAYDLEMELRNQYNLDDNEQGFILIHPEPIQTKDKVKESFHKHWEENEE